jgi:hypothetical protein
MRFKSSVLPEDLHPAPEQGVDGAADHAFVARDDARGEHDEVAGPHLDVLVLAGRDEGDGRVGLALAARGQDDLTLRGQLAQLLERDQEPVRHREVAELGRHRHVAHHALAEERHATLGLLGEIQHLLDAVDVGGERGDDDAPRGVGESGRERGADQTLALRAPRPPDVGRVRA